jgi:hypothetical protein
MLDVVRTNDHTSFLERFPQWRGLYADARLEWDQFTGHIDSVFATIPWPPKQQPTAADGGEGEPAAGGAGAAAMMDDCVKAAKKSGLVAPVLFKMYHRSCAARDVLRDYPQHLFLRMLKSWRREEATATKTHK